MRRRAMYRWKSFWLGVLVLVFLGWAWWDSLWRLKGISGGCPFSTFLLAQYEGRVAMRWSGYMSPWYFNGFGVERRDVASMMWSAWASEVMVLSHGWLMVFWLVPWSAWLLWQWKREQKNLTA